jgi:hypothetical protein
MKAHRTLHITLVLAAGLVLAGSVARPEAATEPSNNVPFTVIETGSTSGIREPRQTVVYDAAAWTALWRAHAGAGSPVPAVDFTHDMIIAVFAGQSTARTVAVSRIARQQDGLVVWYVLRDTAPQSDGQRAGRGSPFQIVRLARLPGAVRFVRLKTPPIVPQP